MNKLILAALMLTPQAAHAATIVQRDSDSGQFGMKGFDSRLGRLDRVTLEVNLSKSRGWFIAGFIPTPTTYDVTWNISGRASVRGLGDVLYFPIFGSGSTTKTVSDASSFEERIVSTGVSGYGFFEIDPSLVIGKNYFVLDPNDNGYYGRADTQIGISNGGNIVELSAYCGTYRSGEDSCGSATSTLTYTYTPSS
jgi:hypothetical protein